jgi:exodeoxyribonuclease-3
MLLVSWNVNGIRAAMRKGLADWLTTTRPHALAVQETKANPADLDEATLRPAGYHGHWDAAERKGYSGVATFTLEPTEWWSGFDSPEFHGEGRVVVTDLGDFDLYNVYFPNSGQGDERLRYKLGFYEAFQRHVDARIGQGRQVIVCGDVNTAHREIDLARPKENRKTPGFLPEECAWLDRMVEAGWVDTFRHMHPEAREAYTWWDQRFGARARNVGWRIDYFFVHRAMVERVVDAGIWPDVQGSDHCPVWLELRD